MNRLALKEAFFPYFFCFCFEGAYFLKKMGALETLPVKIFWKLCFFYKPHLARAVLQIIC